MQIQLLYLIDYQSITNDEFTNIGVGKYYITNKDLYPFVFIDHPPLGYLIRSFFLYGDSYGIWSRTPHDSFYIFQNKVYNINNLMFLTRLPIALTALLLGFYIFKWSRELYGKRAALLAVFLFSFEPNILSHFSIAMTDFAMTTFIFIAVYYWWKFEKNISLMSALSGGMALGLALVSKSPELILVPLFAIFFLNLYRKSFFRLHNISKVVVYFLIAFVVVWSFYGFQVSTIGESVPSKSRVIDLINKTIENDFVRSLAVQTLDVPLPAAKYFAALGTRVWHKNTGNEYYFFGKISKNGLEYYPTVFLLKTPIPLLLLLGVFAISYIFKIRKNSWIDEKFPLIFIAVYFFVLAMFIGLNMGLRHILPIYPFLFLLAGSVVNIKIRRKTAMKGFLVVVALWYLIGALLILPHNMSYFNEFIGGSSNGWLYFADADIDIGQEWNGFAKYIKENNINNVFVPQSIFNVTYDIYLKNYGFAGCEPKYGIYGIPVSQLTLFGNRDCYKWLKERKPDRTIGHAFFVY